MKILTVNVSADTGSTGKICTDLAAALEHKGHEVKIAYGRKEVPLKYRKYTHRIGNEFDVNIHVLGARLFDASGLCSRRVTKRFVKWIKEYDPDVIHIHNVHGYYLNIKIFFDYLKTCKKRIIWTLHDCWAFTGHSAYCDAIQCEKWKAGCEQCPQIDAYPKSYMDCSSRNWRIKKDCFTGIENLTLVSPSEWLANLARQSFLAEYPIEVIHNGIDTRQFYPLENDFRKAYGIGGKIMLLGVSTVWNEMKGLSDYIRLADMLGDDFKVVLVGLRPEQKKKMPENILAFEQTNSIKELAYMYSSADALLVLSEVKNYPSCILEAEACGTYVITYNMGGSGESITDIAGGVVVPKGDLEAVRDTVLRLRNSIHADNGFSSNKCADAYNNVNKNSERGYWAEKLKRDLIGKFLILGVASRWEKRKGLDDLVEIAGKMTEDTAVLAIGLSKSQMNNLPNNLTGIERTSDIDELRRLYSIADVFVNPTYEDNYPTTNLEAIACRTIVVSYETGGSGESARLYGRVSKRNVTDIINEIMALNCEAVAAFDKNIEYKISVEKFLDNYLLLYHS